MRVAAAETTGQYARGVLARLRDQGAPVPVLHPACSDLPAPVCDERITDEDPDWAEVAGVAGLLAWLGDARPGGTGDLLGYGPVEWALPAALHAAATGRALRWFDTAEDALAAITPRSLVLCAHPDLITRRVQDAVIAALSFDTPLGPSPRWPVGFLTARTLPILTRVVAVARRGAGAPVRRAAGLFADRMIGVADDDVLTCLEGQDVTAAGVRALGRPELLMMWGHSREDLFHLGRDALCGRSAEWRRAKPGARRPGCALDGVCVKEGEVLPLTSLIADTVVIGGCHVLRLGGSSAFAPEFSLAFAAQEAGAGAVVSSPWAVVGSPAEFLLLYRLLRGGVALGEAVRMLNAAMPHMGPDSPSYLVLGDGERVLFAPPAPAGTVTTTRDGDRYVINGRGLDAEFVAVRVDLPGRPTVRSRGLYHAVVPEPGGAALIVLFGRGRLTGDIDVTVDLTPPGGDPGRAVTAALATLDAYGRLLRGYHPKLKNIEQEWRSTAVRIARSTAKAKYEGGAALDADKRAAQVADAIAKADRALCEHHLARTASAKSFSIHEQLLIEDATFEVVEHRAAGECPYCGDSVMARVIASVLVPAARRELGICRTCGTVWDRPEHLAPPLVRMDPMLPRGAEHAVELVLENPTDRPVRGWAGVALRNSAVHGTTVTPACVPVELGAGERRSFGFTLVVGPGTPVHADFLRAFWTAELGVAAALRLVWTGP